MTLSALLLVVGAAAAQNGVIEFGRCVDRNENVFKQLVGSDVYKCKFTWRSSPTAQVSSTPISIKLTGYTSSGFDANFDPKKFKRIDAGHRDGAERETMRLLHITRPDDEPGTWFEVEFPYRSCVGDGSPLKLTVEAMGITADWNPHVIELAQRNKSCTAAPTEAPVRPLEVAAANQASDASISFTVILLAIMVCAICIAAQYL